MPKLAVHRIPVCPFSQRLEILLSLKGRPDVAEFHTVDITKPRPEWLLAKTQGSTVLPILETEEGLVLRESLVLLRYLDDRFSEPRIAARDPLSHAIENMLVAMERDFGAAGYQFVMNRDLAAREGHRSRMLAQYAALDAFLVRYARGATFLFDDFGLAEAVFTPLFVRFHFLAYYEGFDLPDDGRFARVRAWRDACLAHPAAQQVTREEVVKLYYDYAKGAGNGALLPGRTISSFAPEPHWSTRPWPPADKYGHSATDGELGLSPSR